MTDTGGTDCNGCGKPCGYAPGIGYFCQNDACTYEKDRARDMLRRMMPIDPKDARITELETALAEAEGRVIADVVAWLRGQADWHDKNDDGWSGFDRIAQGYREAATALETGEWKKY